MKVTEDGTSVNISNKFVSLSFDTTQGVLTSMTNLVSGVTIAVTQNWYWYNSTVCGNGWGHDEPNDYQNSGAYIFRPNLTEAYPVATGPVTFAVVNNGPVAAVVSQTFAGWLTQTVTLYANQPFAEFEWIVGSIPIEDDLGKEVITRFDTNISSSGYVYTDSNGREMQERLFNYRPTWKLNVTEPVAGNYYPVNAAAYIKDTNAQLTVLVDRSQGGASLADGSLELMVHRRILYDDGRGVGEPLNETYGITPYPNPVRLGAGLVIKGMHRLLLDTPATAAATFRPMMDTLYFPPVLAFVPSPSSSWLQSHVTNFSGLIAGADLPVNVHILTLQSWTNTTVLLRLAHQFGVGEDAKLSLPVSVSLNNLFATLKITAVTELSLTANQPVAAMRARKLAWSTVEEDGTVVHAQDAVVDVPAPVTVDAPVVVLNPLQIRTFELTLA